jgi:hypothetical protein
VDEIGVRGQESGVREQKLVARFVGIVYELFLTLDP